MPLCLCGKITRTCEFPGVDEEIEKGDGKAGIAPNSLSRLRERVSAAPGLRSRIGCFGGVGKRMTGEGGIPDPFPVYAPRRGGCAA